jgi:ADP-ribose pyrophosphatase YjhB (NUDIX family)
MKPIHCQNCGSKYQSGGFPKRCRNCGITRWLNPLPVAVLLVPVDEGLLVVRRGIEPQKGKLALPGGFIEAHENWRSAAARELEEETGISVAPEAIQSFGVESANNHLLVFGVAPPFNASVIEAFEPNEETLELLVLLEPTELAFGYHTSMARGFLTGSY